MLEKSYLFWFPSILIVTQNLGFSRGIFVEKWIEQHVDHFNFNNGRTWWMRYYENNEFYHESGPIFIMIGGESEITADQVKPTSFMYKMARTHGAMMYSTEHRYYGKSRPVPDTSSRNLRYLSVSQALADIALFIEFTKNELNSPNAFVMVFGGSYAGNLAAWMRVESPDLVQGALADSAPIYVKADFFEYYEFVENSIRKFDEKCAMNIKEAFSAVEELFKNPMANSIKLKDDFKLYDPDFSQPSEISKMMIHLAEMFGNTVLFNTIGKNGKTSIENLCIALRENEDISPYYRLAEVLKKKRLKNHSCINFKYHHSLNEYLKTSWESGIVADRLWTYQTCTELGYYQTFSSPNSIFGSLISLQYFMNWCEDVFPGVFNPNVLNRGIGRIKCIYNSQLSRTKNIIFTNGDHDPWHSLSVLSNLNIDSPAILINGGSHCDFLKQNEARRTDSLIAAESQVSSMISKWLQTHKNLYR